MPEEEMVGLKVVKVSRRRGCDGGELNLLSFQRVVGSRSREPGGECGTPLRLTARQARVIELAMTGAVVADRAPANTGSIRVYRVLIRVAAAFGIAVRRVIMTAWRGGEGRVRVEVGVAAGTWGIGVGAAAGVTLAMAAGAPILALRSVLDRAGSLGGLAEEARGRGVRDERVLASIAAVPRQRFIPEADRDLAFSDSALPIGEQQTVSQPSLVARMTELISPAFGHKVLEVGVGAGYQAAILARLVDHVYSIEILPGLVRAARERLRNLGVTNVTVREGDGYRGWPEQAPFDGIVVTCATRNVPRPLVEQLKDGGRMVVPVRAPHGHEDLVLVTKLPGGRTTEEKISECWFVPMTGEHGVE